MIEPFLPTRTIGVLESRLPTDEVHVWRFRLDRSDGEIRALKTCLTPNERDRAARCRFPRDAKRFIAARVMQRRILARYLGQPPTELRFDYASYGKPYLPSAQNSSDIRFNLSYSHDWGVLGVCRGAEVGIDIEYRCRDFPYTELVSGYFASAERRALESLPAAKRLSAFYTLWTLKEAHVKARGTGLGIGLESLDIAVDSSGSTIGWMVRPTDPGEADRWFLSTLDLVPSYATALVIGRQHSRAVVREM